MCISGVKFGTVRYFGKTHFAEGDWCGVELDDADGKHDGTVENVRYFTCQPGYGIFAPTIKVELVEDSSRGQNKVEDENGNGNEGIRSHLRQPEFKSKLSKPKAIVKPLGKESPVDSDNDSASGSPVNVTGIPKPSKLPTGIAKPSKLPLHAELNQKKEVKEKPSTKNSESGKNVTFSLEEDNTETREENFDYDIPDVTTPSRVDPVRALTLAYDLESSGSDTENRAKKHHSLNETFTRDQFEKQKK